MLELIFSYLETWQITKKPLYRTVCEETIRYLVRDMRHPLGGFFSAEMPTLKDMKAIFYTWKLDEIRNILGPEESALFCAYYGVTPEGNFEGRNILHISQRLERFLARTRFRSRGIFREAGIAETDLMESERAAPAPFQR